MPEPTPITPETQAARLARVNEALRRHLERVATLPPPPLPPAWSLPPPPDWSVGISSQGIQHVVRHGDSVTIRSNSYTIDPHYFEVQPAPTPMPMPSSQRIHWSTSPWAHYEPAQLDSESHINSEHQRVGDLLNIPYHSPPPFIPRVQQGARRAALLVSVTAQAEHYLRDAEMSRDHCSNGAISNALYAIANHDDEAIRLGLARRLSILMSCYFEAVTNERRQPTSVEKQRIAEAASQLHGWRQAWQQKVSTHLDKEVARGRYHSRDHALTRLGLPNQRNFEQTQMQLATIASSGSRMSGDNLVSAVTAAQLADGSQ